MHANAHLGEQFARQCGFEVALVRLRRGFDAASARLRRGFGAAFRSDRLAKVKGRRWLKAKWESRRGNFHDDANVPSSEPKRILWMVLGFIALGLGVLGAILPVMPAWIFAIIAAACFARSSPKFYNWVLSNKYLGPVAYEWREQHTLPKKVKYGALVAIVGGLGFSIAFIVPHVIAKLVVGVLGLAAAVWLLRVRTSH
jgi:uncharacterized protein